MIKEKGQQGVSIRRRNLEVIFGKSPLGIERGKRGITAEKENSL